MGRAARLTAPRLILRFKSLLTIKREFLLPSEVSQMKHMCKLSFALLATLFLLTASLNAQTAGAGTITGTVTDPSGGAVPGASVMVKNTATATERALMSNEAGIFVAQFLQPGSYEITVSKQGFSKTVRKGLTLQVGQIVSVTIPLTLQATNETVTV